MFIHRRIYNKASGKIAKKRLKNVLISDRTRCLPEISEQINADIINVFSKYYEIYSDSLEITIIHNDLSDNVLVAKILLK